LNARINENNTAFILGDQNKHERFTRGAEKSDKGVLYKSKAISNAKPWTGKKGWE